MGSLQSSSKTTGVYGFSFFNDMKVALALPFPVVKA